MVPELRRLENRQKNIEYESDRECDDANYHLLQEVFWRHLKAANKNTKNTWDNSGAHYNREGFCSY